MDEVIESEVAAEIAAMADPATWTETRGAGSFDAVICPLCGERSKPPGLLQLALAIRCWIETGLTAREKRLLAQAVLSIGVLGDNVEPAFALAAKLGITDIVAAESERFFELAVMPAVERDARLIAALHKAKGHPDFSYSVRRPATSRTPRWKAAAGNRTPKRRRPPATSAGARK